MNKVSF
jgi:hypothetical protein